ncbi:unnamed protein product [Ectocarpus sp. 12 AP-2014]
MTKRANPPPLSRSLVQDNVPAKVTDRLWIGSIHAAFNQDSMQDRGITHVLNASGLPATFPRQFTYFTVDIRDKESSNILTAIGAVNIFVEAGIEKGGVLVHCAGGRSRSAAFVVAFIMSTQGCSYDAAYAQVRRARPVASVNRGFEQQLRAYGAAQCDVFAAHQMMLRIRGAALLDRRNLLLLRRSSGVTPSETVGDGAEGGEAAERTRTSPTRPSAQQQPGARGAAAAAGSVSTAGIPRTPRSPRGRGRSPAGINPAISYRQQRRWSGSGNGSTAVTTSVVAAATAAAAAAAAAAAGAGKSREEQMQFLPKEPRPIRFRLCRPGSASVQVIPPLKSLERVYACRGCGAFLLTGGHIIKPNIDLPSLQAVLARSSPRNQADQYAPNAGASPLSLVTSNSSATITSSMAASQQQSPPCSGSASASGGSSSCSGGTDTVATRGRGDRRSPSPLSERRGQSRVAVATTTTVSVSSGSPTTRRSAAARRPPPPLRVITTELGLDRPPMHNRWVPEGFLAGVQATTAGAGPPLQGATVTVGGGGAGGGGGTAVAEAIRLQSPLGFTPSPSRLRPWAAGRCSSGAATGGGGGGGGGCAGDSRCGDGQRNSSVFAFESEDDSSNVDPFEREGEGTLAEAYPVAVDAIYTASGSGGSGVISVGSGGGGMSYPGWEGAVGSGGGSAGCRRLRRATGTPTNATLLSGEFNLMLSSKVPLSAGSGMESVSPLMTPRSPGRRLRAGAPVHARRTARFRIA